MKKKLVMLILCIGLSLQMIGCGNAADPVKDSLEREIEELREELRDLKKENSKTDKEKGSENTDVLTEVIEAVVDPGSQEDAMWADWVVEKSGYVGADLKWEYGGGILKISGTGVIPSDVKECWSEIPGKIYRLYIEDGVTAIENGAFEYVRWGNYDEYSLAYVKLPATLEKIGDNAFYECENLEKVDFNCPVLKYIGNNAFDYCHLKELDLSSTGVECIGEEAVRSDNLRKVVLPDTLSYMCDHAIISYWDPNVEWGVAHGEEAGSAIDGDNYIIEEWIEYEYPVELKDIILDSEGYTEVVWKKKTYSDNDMLLKALAGDGVNLPHPGGTYMGTRSGNVRKEEYTPDMGEIVYEYEKVVYVD